MLTSSNDAESAPIGSEKIFGYGLFSPLDAVPLPPGGDIQILLHITSSLSL
jgi:hypothetical protein